MSFQAGDTKLERCLRKNQHAQTKLLNFENWFSGKLSKVRHHFSNKVILKLILAKNVGNKKCLPKLLFFNEKQIEKYSDDFPHRKLTLKVKFWHILTPPHYTNSQNSTIFLWVC